MKKPKSVYLSGYIIEQIDNINPYFIESKLEPSESTIISAALVVYKEYLEHLRNKKILEEEQK